MPRRVHLAPHASALALLAPALQPRGRYLALLALASPLRLYHAPSPRAAHNPSVPFHRVVTTWSALVDRSLMRPYGLRLGAPADWPTTSADAR
jgi:hypothetical protein